MFTKPKVVQLFNYVQEALVNVLKLSKQGSKAFVVAARNHQDFLLKDSTFRGAHHRSLHQQTSCRFYSNIQMQPKAQYDIIGDKYLYVRSSLKTFELAEYTLLKQLNFKLSGERVIDLACGNGICTRAIKKMGAGKVVGVDISKEMIVKAINEEKINPLGIEYIEASVDEMKIESGSFDIATAFYLLPYAKSKKQLELFLKNIHSILKNGGMFFSINNNMGKNVCMNPRYLQQYGIVYKVEGPSQTGSSVIVSLSAGDVNVDLQIWYYTQEDYIDAAKLVGFTEVVSLPFELPDHMKGAPYWDGFNQYNTLQLMICKK